MSELNRNINVGAMREAAVISPVEAQKKSGLEGQDVLSSERRGIGTSGVKRVLLMGASCILAGSLAFGCGKGSSSPEFDGGFDTSCDTDTCSDTVDIYDTDTNEDTDSETGTSDTDVDTDSDTDTDTETVDAGTDSGTDLDTDSDTDTDTETETETIDAGTDSGTDLDTDSDMDTDTDTDTDSDTDTETETETETDTETDTETATDVDTDSDTDTDVDSDSDSDGDTDTLVLPDAGVDGGVDGGLDGGADLDTDSDSDTDTETDTECIELDADTLADELDLYDKDGVLVSCQSIWANGATADEYMDGWVLAENFNMIYEFEDGISASVNGMHMYMNFAKMDSAGTHFQGEDYWAVGKVDPVNEKVKIVREMWPAGDSTFAGPMGPGTFYAGNEVDLGSGYMLRLDGVSPLGVAIYSVRNGETNLGSFPAVAGNIVTIPYLPSGMDRKVLVHSSNGISNMVDQSVGVESRTLQNGATLGNGVMNLTFEGDLLVEIAVSEDLCEE